MTDGPMIYHPAGMADLSHGMLTFAQELEDVGQRAQHLLAMSQAFFQGPQGAESYAIAQNHINEGIRYGQEIIMRHGNVIDQVASNMVGTDGQVGNSFQA